jgi:thienamycin biosynthesis protein ThnN
MDPLHIKNILALHFHPEQGSPFWLERQQQLNFNVRDEIRSRQDFHRLGPMDIGALRTRPVTDFIPRVLHRDLSAFLLSETGGTTGDPCRRVFSPQEFHDAFIAPWLQAVAEHNFPRGGRWLFVGPGGPHIIDRSARYMARSLGSLEPFTVDCDVRWIKRQAKGSMGLKLYLDHVLAQAANIVSHQAVSTLFTTPPLLVALAEVMHPGQKEQILGIHTGGMNLEPQTALELQGHFPNAVILPGYGNSLFGVTFPQVGGGEGSAAEAGIGMPSTPEMIKDDVFQVQDSALWLQLAPIPENEQAPQDLITCVAPGQRGRVILHRLDPSFLILNLAERDTAVAVACADGKMGLACIAPLQFATPLDRQGVY